MGEYALRLSDRTEVKIGTCEDMYYLRADQRRQVSAIPNSLDPNSDVALSIRFRFPWPDEDGTAPGEFDPFERGVTVPGYTAPSSTDHGMVQFVARAGYVVSLPCPEGLHEQKLTPHGPQIHRNGFVGAVQLVQQKLLKDGRLVPVCRCGGCGAAWRLEDANEIEALAVAFRVEGDRKRKGSWTDAGEFVGHEWWHAVADRILSGAQLTPTLVTT